MQAPCGARLGKGQKRQPDHSILSAMHYFNVAARLLCLRATRTGYRRLDEENVSHSNTYGSSFVNEKVNWRKEENATCQSTPSKENNSDNEEITNKDSLTGNHPASARTEPSIMFTPHTDIVEQQSRERAAYLQPIELFGPMSNVTQKTKQAARVSVQIRGFNPPPIPLHYFAPSALRAFRSTILFFAGNRCEEISEDILDGMYSELTAESIMLFGAAGWYYNTNYVEEDPSEYLRFVEGSMQRTEEWKGVIREMSQYLVNCRVSNINPESITEVWVVLLQRLNKQSLSKLEEKKAGILT
jgi:hypothetical protein